MAKEFDYLEKEALRYGAGVPADTKWRNLSDEQRQGFDNYMRTKIRRDPSVYADDSRAKKYLKDYDSSTFDQMRQQEIKDSVNPGGIWDDFGGAADSPVQSDFNYGDDDYNPDRSDDTRAREDEQDDLRDEDENESDKKPDASDSPEDSPEGKPKEPKADGVEAAKTAKGLGDASKAVEGAEALGGGAAAGGAGAGAAVGAGAAAEGGTAAAAAGMAAPEILTVVAFLVAFFLIVLLLVGVSWGSPDSADAKETEGGANTTDGTRDELAKLVLDNKYITFQDNTGKIDIGKNCDTARIGWDPSDYKPKGYPGQKCIQKSTLQLMLAIADFYKDKHPSLRLEISSTIRDHPPSINTSSIHLSGLAFDIGNESTAKDLMPWLYENRKILKINELIFDNSLIGKGSNTYNVFQGKKHTYSSSTISEHRNHIHVATFP